MKVKDAVLVGKVSKGNGKMPGTTFSIDAFACQTGSKLAQQENTSCSKCYARQIQRIRPSVDQGYKANLAKWESANEDQWVNSMVFQLNRYCTEDYHRWFDSGDLQSPKMFGQICEVARQTPNIKHWLPTQERSFVKIGRTLYGNEPGNMAVRVSGTKINGKAPNEALSSTVFDRQGSPEGFECRLTEGKCGPCRACWDTSIRNVAYPLNGTRQRRE